MFFLINRYLLRAKIDYNAFKLKYGLGKSIHFKKTESNGNKKESKPRSPKPVPGISVQTLR